MVVDMNILVSWKDPRLRWDPERYRGLSAVRVASPQRIWTPQLASDLYVRL